MSQYKRNQKGTYMTHFLLERLLGVSNRPWLDRQPVRYRIGRALRPITHFIDDLPVKIRWSARRLKAALSF